MRCLKMKIAVTGALGQLGRELCRQIGPQAVPLDIDTLDITEGQAVFDALLALRPDTVINCAAYTQVDKAETQPELAYAVNAAAVEHLARVCAELDCPLVEISTDYVFGGEKVQGPGFGVQGSWSGTEHSAFSIQHSGAGSHPSSLISHRCADRPYREDDPPAPQGVYARSKLAGELAAQKHEKHIIVRTCGLYARPSDNRAKSFVKTMLRLAADQSEVRVVADQHCTPSYVPHVARAVLFLAGLNGPGPAPWGIYHITNTGATTWYNFAVEIFKLAGVDVGIKPITTAEYGAPAPRPSYSVLDTGRYHRLGGPAMPDWQRALAEYFSEWRELQS
jgi:dTDP-4-dehydrorhamnose reductase